MRISRASLLFLGLLQSSLTLAADKGQLQPVPESAPDPVGPMEDGQPISPDVTIVQRKDATVEEYRAGGRLYMVKVTPFIGKPYYLIDEDGDGSLETRVGNLINQTPTVPQWVIFSW